MLETNGEHTSQPEQPWIIRLQGSVLELGITREHTPQPVQRRVIRLIGTVIDRDVAIVAAYDCNLLGPNALLNPSLARGDMPDDYVPDPSVWTL